MLNLHDLSLSDLQSYCDGLNDSIEILEEYYSIDSKYKSTIFTKINDQYFEAQREIQSRFAELEQ